MVEGAVLHERGLSILADIAEAEAAISAGRLSARGVLRVTSTIVFRRRHVVPAAAFVERYPEAGIRLSLIDGIAGLVGRGFDFAITVGRLEQADIIIHRMAVNRHVACGVPACLARAGTPCMPKDLRRHACLVIERASGPLDLRGAGRRTVKVIGPHASDHGEAIHDWALAETGLMLTSIRHVSSRTSLLAGSSLSWRGGRHRRRRSLRSIQAGGIWPSKRVFSSIC